MYNKQQIACVRDEGNCTHEHAHCVISVLLLHHVVVVCCCCTPPLHELIVVGASCTGGETRGHTNNDLHHHHHLHLLLLLMHHHRRRRRSCCCFGGRASRTSPDATSVHLSVCTYIIHRTTNRSSRERETGNSASAAREFRSRTGISRARRTLSDSRSLSLPLARSLYGQGISVSRVLVRAPDRAAATLVVSLARALLLA